jgi:hypothetical protein
LVLPFLSPAHTAFSAFAIKWKAGKLFSDFSLQQRNERCDAKRKKSSSRDLSVNDDGEVGGLKEVASMAKRKPFFFGKEEKSIKMKRSIKALEVAEKSFCESRESNENERTRWKDGEKVELLLWLRTLPPRPT